MEKIKLELVEKSELVEKMKEKFDRAVKKIKLLNQEKQEYMGRMSLEVDEKVSKESGLISEIERMKSVCEEQGEKMEKLKEEQSNIDGRNGEVERSESDTDGEE